MTRPPDDDLFTPTLCPEDDASEFDRPWNPWSLVVLTFFFGLLAGGSLLAFNFERLGARGRRYPALAVAFVAGVALIAATQWSYSQGWVNPADRDARRTLRWIVTAISVMIASGIAVQQRKRYRLFRVSHLPSGNVLLPGAAAAAASLALTVLLHSLFASLFPR